MFVVVFVMLVAVVKIQGSHATFTCHCHMCVRDRGRAHGLNNKPGRFIRDLLNLVSVYGTLMFGLQKNE